MSRCAPNGKWMLRRNGRWTARITEAMQVELPRDLDEALGGVDTGIS